MIYTRIIGTGSYFPEKVMSNHDFEKFLDTSDEWIFTRTGIKFRHIADKDELNSDMAYEASIKAIEMSGVQPGEIEGVIMCTYTPDYAMPVSSAMVASRLGLSGAFSFDLNMACSGFLYGLHVADGLIKSGKHKKILVVASEKCSASLDYTDRSTCILFGDGAGAVVLSADTQPGVHSSLISSDGHLQDIITVKAMGSYYTSHHDQISDSDSKLKMKGNETFRLAVKHMCDISLDAIKASGIVQSDINFLISHQANVRIIESVAKRLGVDMSFALMNIYSRGNTASATIPTVLDEAVRAGTITRGSNILFSAFGGGAGWGSAVVTF